MADATLAETPQQIAARFGRSIEFGREHQGRHRCVDGRWYLYSCLISDPGSDRVGRSYLALLEAERANGETAR